MSTLLSELQCHMQTCHACELHKYRTNVVFGVGNTDKPKLFIVGEAPGEDEDKAGEPFIGKAGKKLSQMLTFANIKREDIFISNSVLCRPPNNRTPNIDELNACRWRLHLQIKLIQPKLILLLGRAALTTMLAEEFKGSLKQYMKTDYMKFNIDGQEYDALCSFHPSYHLRCPNRAYQESIHIWTKIRDVYNG